MIIKNRLQNILKKYQLFGNNAFKAGVVFLTCLILACCVEIFGFNLSYWIYNPIISSNNLAITELSPDTSLPDENNPNAVHPGIPPNVVSYKQITINDSIYNVDAATLKFDVDISKKTENNKKTYHDFSTVKLKVYIADSGSALAPYQIIETEFQPQSQKIHTGIKVNGYLKQIIINVYSENTDLNINVDNISLNEPLELKIFWERIQLLFVCFLLIFCIRPRGILWKIKHIEKPYIAPIVIALIIGGSCLAFNHGFDEPDNAWQENGYRGAADEYAALARSFVDKGELYLQESPADSLSNLDGLSNKDRLKNNRNIYDPSVRDKVITQEQEDVFESGEDIDNISKIYYKTDAAYYNQHYYVYFGVVPVVLAYVPYYMITGNDLGNTTLIFISLIILALFSYLIIDLLVRRKFYHVSAAIIILSYIVCFLSSGIIYTLVMPFFYNIPVIFGIMFLFIGSYILLRGYYTNNNIVRVILTLFGTLFLILTIGCRPQLTITAFVGGILYLVFLARRGKTRFCWDCVLSMAAAVLIPIIIVVGSIGFYNYLRFDSFVDFGANYNLTGNDMTLRGFNLFRMLEGTFYYLFGSIHITTTWPFIEQYYYDHAFVGIVVNELSFGGLFLICPFLLFTIFFLNTLKSKKIMAVSCTLIITALIIIMFNTEGAGILYRYTQDFGWNFGAAFVLGWLYYDNKRCAKLQLLQQREAKNKNTQQVQSKAGDGLYSLLILLIFISIIITLLIWISLISVVGSGYAHDVILKQLYAFLL